MRVPVTVAVVAEPVRVVMTVIIAVTVGMVVRLTMVVGMVMRVGMHLRFYCTRTHEDKR
jgi:hypothetical protein